MSEAMGVVIAAVITSAIAFLGLLISKELKISELRQAWIDALRNDIAELVASAGALTIATGIPNLEREVRDELHKAQKLHLGNDEILRLLHLPTKMWDNIKDYAHTVAHCIARIRLRINPEETKSLCDLLTKLEHEISGSDTSKAGKIMDQIISESQTLLKLEWNRVKRGEPLFYRMKILSSAVLIVSLLCLIFYFFYTYTPMIVDFL